MFINCKKSLVFQLINTSWGQNTLKKSVSALNYANNPSENLFTVLSKRYPLFVFLLTGYLYYYTFHSYVVFSSEHPRKSLKWSLSKIKYCMASFKKFYPFHFVVVYHIIFTWDDIVKYAAMSPWIKIIQHTESRHCWRSYRIKIFKTRITDRAFKINIM